MSIRSRIDAIEFVLSRQYDDDARGAIPLAWTLPDPVTGELAGPGPGEEPDARALRTFAEFKMIDASVPFCAEID